MFNFQSACCEHWFLLGKKQLFSAFVSLTEVNLISSEKCTTLKIHRQALPLLDTWQWKGRGLGPTFFQWKCKSFRFLLSKKKACFHSTSNCPPSPLPPPFGRAHLAPMHNKSSQHNYWYVTKTQLNTHKRRRRNDQNQILHSNLLLFFPSLGQFHCALKRS